MKGLKIAGWLFSKCWIDLSNCHLTPLMCSSFSDDHSLPSSCILLPHLFLQTTNWKHSKATTRQSEISHIFSNRFSLCRRNCRKQPQTTNLFWLPQEHFYITHLKATHATHQNSQVMQLNFTVFTFSDRTRFWESLGLVLADILQSILANFHLRWTERVWI